MVRIFEPPVYCYHEIVHNRLVVDRFRELGVVFVDDVDDVPAGSAAHAVGARLGARSGGRGPAKAGSWSTRCAPSSPRCTTRRRCGRRRASPCSTSATAATTRRRARWRWRRTRSASSRATPTSSGCSRRSPIRRRWRCSRRPRSRCTTGRASSTGPRAEFPELWTAARNDLCFATTNRQAALQAIAVEADAIVVIGSANSSNTLALTKVAVAAAGCPDRAAGRRARRARRRRARRRSRRRRHRRRERTGRSRAGGDRATGAHRWRGSRCT